MLQIETLVGMTKTMLADEDFIETFTAHIEGEPSQPYQGVCG